MEITLQAKQLNDPGMLDPGMGQDGHKYLLRIELKAKGETEMEARNVKINAGFSQSVTGLKNALMIQLGITENKFLGLKNCVFCVLFSSDFSPNPAEVEDIRIETVDKENTVQGSASLRYGNGNSCRNTLTSTNVVFDQSTHVDSDQILTQNYSMALDLHKSPPLVRSLMDKLTTLFKVANLGHDTTKLDVIKTASLKSEMIVKNNRDADIKIETDSGTSVLKGVKIPPFLRQRGASRGQGSPHHCTQTIDWVKTMDALNITSNPSTCWSLLSGNCQEAPGF